MTNAFRDWAVLSRTANVTFSKALAKIPLFLRASANSAATRWGLLRNTPQPQAPSTSRGLVLGYCGAEDEFNPAAEGFFDMVFISVAWAHGTGVWGWGCDDGDLPGVIEKFVVVVAEDGNPRGDDDVVGIEKRMAFAVGFVVGGLGAEARVEGAGAGEGFFLGLGTVEKAPPGFLAEAKFRAATDCGPNCSTRLRAAAKVDWLTTLIFVLNDRVWMMVSARLRSERSWLGVIRRVW